MNCVIGLCERDHHWPSLLSDLDYRVRLIEQSLRTSSGYMVKPDIVAVSSRLFHSLVIEIKSGPSIDVDQLARYDSLKAPNLRNYLETYLHQQLTLDICYVGLEANRVTLLPMLGTHPLLTFDNSAIRKSGQFSQYELERKFSEPISLTGKHPPVSYYPFSEEDEDDVFLDSILRMVVQTALKASRGRSPSALIETTFNSEDMVKYAHPYWDALSTDQRAVLSQRIKKIIDRLMARYLDLTVCLNNLESRRGYKILGQLSRITELVERIKEGERKQPPLNHYTQP